MNIIVQQGPIAIRKMENCPEDFSVFLQWMTHPETMKYWDGMSKRYTYEDVAQQYRDHLEEQVQPCIILDQNTPIGYCQFYEIDAKSYEVPSAQYDAFFGGCSRVFGIDIFLGDVSYRNRGVGTQVMKLLSWALFTLYLADALAIDPKAHNVRAIRCYRKCGFEDCFVVPQRELQDGVYHDSLIMRLKRPFQDPSAGAAQS